MNGNLFAPRRLYAWVIIVDGVRDMLADKVGHRFSHLGMSDVLAIAYAPLHCSYCALGTFLRI